MVSSSRNLITPVLTKRPASVTAKAAMGVSRIAFSMFASGSCVMARVTMCVLPMEPSPMVTMAMTGTLW